MRRSSKYGRTRSQDKVEHYQSNFTKEGSSYVRAKLPPTSLEAPDPSSFEVP